MASGIGSYDVSETCRVQYREDCAQWLVLAVAEGISYEDRAMALDAAEDSAALSAGAEVLWGSARRADGAPRAWGIRCLLAAPTVYRVQV